MSKKHNHIDHLTPELFKAYQEGSLSADEMYAIEKFLLENPFEAEALEGLETIATDALDGHLADLNTRLEAKLSEDEETRIIFWTMTRKIAASLLVLFTAAFLFFWQEPDITDVTTKELTQNDDEILGASRKAAPDTLELQSSDGDANTLTARTESDSEHEAGEEKNEDTDLSNGKSGFFDSSKLEAKAENSPTVDPIAEIADEESLEITELTLDNDFKAAVSEETQNENNKPLFDTKKEIMASPPALSAKAIAMTASDSIRTELEAKTMEKALLGRVAGVQLNDGSKMQANFKAKNDTETDSNRVSGFSNATNRAKAKAALYSISGVVADNDGNPLPSVQVQIKGTSIGILTDANGAYKLSSTAVIGSLLFRYLGYTTKEEEVKDRKVINVAMLPDVSSLGEVVVSDYNPAQSPDDEVLTDYKPALPVYGKKAFNKHVKENLIYPEAAAANNIQGRVLVEFTVTADGKLEGFKILKGLGYGCDKEAIRLIKTGPVWQARKGGINRTTPVDSKVKVRIRFKP